MITEQSLNISYSNDTQCYICVVILAIKVTYEISFKNNLRINCYFNCQNYERVLTPNSL